MRISSADVRERHAGPCRRRGFGSALLTHGEAFCASAGYRRIELSTSELQPAAMALYAARGYRLAWTATATQ